MALFDFAIMGGEYLKKDTKKGKKDGSKLPAGTPPPVILDPLDQGPVDESLLYSDLMISDYYDSDADTVDTVQSGSSSESGSVKSSSSLWKRGKAKTGRQLSRIASFKFFQKRVSEGDEGTEKQQVVQPLRYEPIPVSRSNALTLQAYEAGWGPAYSILKSMDVDSRTQVLKALFIKRKAETYNDEVDSHDIIFKSIFGLRARASTALRQVGLLKKATWMHALVKSGTALELNAKMVISSGDWRFPTRITDSLKRKDALKATQDDFEDRNSVLLHRIESRFYRKLQLSVEARLGQPLADAIADWVMETAGEANTNLFTVYKETRDAKRRKQAKKKKKKKNRRSDTEEVGTPANLEDTQAQEQDAEMEKLETAFQIPEMVANIERAKPGFGCFAILLIQTFALKAKADMDGKFEYTNKKTMMKKLAVVGAKDAVLGLSIGIPLATFVNPFLGFPLMTMSLINLSAGSTELNIVEVIAMMQIHVLCLAANGTCVRDFH